MVDKTAIIYDIIFETQAAGKDIATLNAQMKTLADTNQRLMRTVGGAAKSVKEAGQAYGKAGQGIQNASYQVADFATQVAGGAGVTRALSQQLPQLLGGMGALGAVAGAAVAILVPLGSALLGVKDYAKEVDDALKSMNENLSVANTPLAELNEKYGSLGVSIKEVANGLANLNAEKATRALQDQAAAALEASNASTFYVRFLDAMKLSWDELVTSVQGAGDFMGTAFGDPEIYNQQANNLNKFRSEFSLTADVAQEFGDEYLIIQEQLRNGDFELAAELIVQFKNEIANSATDIQDKLLPVLQAMQDKLVAAGQAALVTGLQVNSIAKTDFGNTNTPGESTVNKVGGSDSEAAKKAARDLKKSLSEAEAAARKTKSELAAFILETERGVTPLQKLEERLASAKREFERFNAQMSPAQRANAQAYVVDLQKKIDDLKFKEKFDEMKAGIDAAKESVSPLITSLMEIQNAVTNDFATGITDAFVAFATGAASAKEAFTQFAADFLKKIAQMILQSLLLYAIQSALGMTGVAPSQGGGGILSGIGGLFGRSGIGPREGSDAATPAFRSTAAAPSLQAGRILPSAAAAGGASNNRPTMNVSITNNVSSANVSTRQNQNGDLEIMVEEIMASKAQRGGNKFDRAMQQGYGLRRAGK